MRLGRIGEILGLHGELGRRNKGRVSSQMPEKKGSSRRVEPDSPPEGIEAIDFLSVCSPLRVSLLGFNRRSIDYHTRTTVAARHRHRHTLYTTEHALDSSIGFGSGEGQSMGQRLLEKLNRPCARAPPPTERRAVDSPRG